MYHCWREPVLQSRSHWNISTFSLVSYAIPHDLIRLPVKACKKLPKEKEITSFQSSRWTNIWSFFQISKFSVCLWVLTPHTIIRSKLSHQRLAASLFTFTFGASICVVWQLGSYCLWEDVISLVRSSKEKKSYFGRERTWLTNTKVVSTFTYGSDIVVTQRVRVVHK